jgi:hypothetical protein
MYSACPRSEPPGFGGATCCREALTDISVIRPVLPVADQKGGAGDPPTATPQSPSFTRARRRLPSSLSLRDTRGGREPVALPPWTPVPCSPLWRSERRVRLGPDDRGSSRASVRSRPVETPAYQRSNAQFAPRRVPAAAQIRPNRQRAGAPSGTPGLLRCQEAGVSPRAPGRRPKGSGSRRRRTAPCRRSSSTSEWIDGGSGTHACAAHRPHQRTGNAGRPRRP